MYKKIKIMSIGVRCYLNCARLGDSLCNSEHTKALCTGNTDGIG